MKKEKYHQLMNSAKLSVVKFALGNAASGLDCNLFITFSTKMVDVVMTEDLRLKYPDQMSIVLHNQFRELRVLDDSFSVYLSFAQKEQNLKIPFFALLYFLDKECDFDLEFDTQSFDEQQIPSAAGVQDNINDSAKIINLSDRIKKAKDEYEN